MRRLGGLRLGSVASSVLIEVLTTGTFDYSCKHFSKEVLVLLPLHWGRQDVPPLNLFSAAKLATRSTRSRSRGQSLAEFTLILPILLVLLLTVADFGRLFAAGITIESAARAAAETAANTYLIELRLAPGGIPPLSGAAYDRVHQAAWQSVCDEAATLPNATPGTLGTQCDGLPTVVCVHDGNDPAPNCSTIDNATGSGSTGCALVNAGSSNAQTGGSESSKYVEVRVCYRFSTIFSLNIPFFGGSLSPLAGNFYLEKVRTFTVADY
jgi:TadE-like protein